MLEGGMTQRQVADGKPKRYLQGVELVPKAR